MFNGRKKQQSHFTAGDSKKQFQKNMDFTVSEQYKLLRTNISFTLPEDVKCPIIGVTSSMRGEGKSTTSVNLSYALAQSGKKVLLIDGDLRLPSVAKKMKLGNTKGLSNMLFDYDSQQLEEYKSQYLDNWYIVPAGEFRIVIAHFERCIPAQKRGMLDYLLENDLLIQANASYFLERRTKRRAISLLKKNKIHFLGSDSHNMKERAPRLYAAYNLIGKKLGEPD